jgi:hypothetical protein
METGIHLDMADGCSYCGIPVMTKLYPDGTRTESLYHDGTPTESRNHDGTRTTDR